MAAIEWNLILQVLWTAPVAAIGVTALFSLAIVGVTRASEMQRAHRGGAATGYIVLAALAFAGVTGGVIFGIGVILDK